MRCSEEPLQTWEFVNAVTRRRIVLFYAFVTRISKSVRIFRCSTIACEQGPGGGQKIRRTKRIGEREKP